MSERYLALKRRFITVFIVRMMLVGISAGLLCGSAIALAQKLILESIDAGLCLLVGGGVTFVSSLLCALLTLPNEKRFARVLDEKNSLSEKVQTMLAFKSKEGAILELQRNDTNEALEGVTLKGYGIKGIIFSIVIILIGAGMLIGAISITYEPDPPPPVIETPFELTELQALAIEELITYVNESKMDSPYKENISAAIGFMLSELRAADTVKKKDAAIEKALDEIYKQTDDSSLTVELIGQLWARSTPYTQALARALNYYEWPKLDEWDKFVDRMTDFRGTFIVAVNDGEEMTEEKKASAFKVMLEEAGIGIGAAISSAKLESNDMLYIHLTRLTSANEENESLGTRIWGFSTLAKKADELGYTDAQRELDATFDALNSEIFNALSKSLDNTGTGEYAMTRICSLFGYELPVFERPNFYESGDEGSGGGDGGGGGGGIGGGAVFGSDDLVYDPNTNTYVEYGVILDRYYSLMFGKLQDGDYTEEEKKALEKYFDILYGGFEEENNENID